MMLSAFIRLRNQILVFLACSLFFVFLALRLAVPINLTAVDIGRHVKNGELIVKGEKDLLFKNYYSFTSPEYPFINHHWLFGVLAYMIWKAWDFAGVQCVYIALCLLGLFFFLRAALLRGHGAVVFLCVSLALPLLWDRREIRPEGLSIFLMGLYFYVLTKLSLGQIRPGWAFILLPFMQVVWVNSHIFFFMGPLLAALFLWEGAARNCSVCVRHLLPLLLILLLVNLINPSGLAGALTPLNIFKGFGYRLAENQNVFFMIRRFTNPTYFYFLFTVLFLFLGIGLACFRRESKVNWPFIILSFFIALAGIKAIRLMMPFGFFFVVMGSFFWGQVEGKVTPRLQTTIRPWIFVVAIMIGAANFVFFTQPALGVGLIPGVNASADFFKKEGLKGPIFSNYDIGGYLVYHLADQEKVFVDNRQEAFPPNFFTETYIPMQENNEIWQKMDTQYEFNVIYFYRHDLTPWGQNFLVERIKDAQWVPVFVDGYTIIFIKKMTSNQPLIDRFALPQSMFSINLTKP